MFHVPAVEDFWIHQNILGHEPALKTISFSLKDTEGGSAYASHALGTLLDYWRVVEQNSLAYFAALTDDELKRVVSVHDAPEERYTVDGLLWYVMIHEMRHAAQIAVLLRTQGSEPSWLDLNNYLPFA